MGHSKPAGNLVSWVVVTAPDGTRSVFGDGPEAQPAKRPITPENARTGMSRIITRQEFARDRRVIKFFFILPLGSCLDQEGDNAGSIPIAFGEAIVIALRYDSRGDPHRT